MNKVTNAPYSPLFVDYDPESGMYCVFNEDGKALSSWCTKDGANQDLSDRNAAAYSAYRLKYGIGEE